MLVFLTRIFFLVYLSLSGAAGSAYLVQQGGIPSEEHGDERVTTGSLPHHHQWTAMYGRAKGGGNLYELKEQ